MVNPPEQDGVAAVFGQTRVLLVAEVGRDVLKVRLLDPLNNLLHELLLDLGGIDMARLTDLERQSLGPLAVARAHVGDVAARPQLQELENPPGFLGLGPPEIAGRHDDRHGGESKPANLRGRKGRHTGG